MIIFSQTLFGLWFVMRTSQLFRDHALINTSTVTKTGTVFNTIILLIAFSFANNSTMNAFLILLVVICNFLLLNLLERRQIDTLKSEFPLFLDRWILNIKMGLGSRAARDKALAALSLPFQMLIQPIFAVNPSDSTDRRHVLLTSSMLNDLQRINAESHLTLSRLETLRSNIRKTEDFRRRSGQATQQVRIQATVMLFIQLALALYMIPRYGLRQIGDFLTLSTLLCIAGLVSMLLLAKKSSWNI